jgi:hypothetical protein
MTSPRQGVRSSWNVGADRSRSSRRRRNSNDGMVRSPLPPSRRRRVRCARRARFSSCCSRSCPAAAAKTAAAPTGATCAADVAGLDNRPTASAARHSQTRWLTLKAVVPRFPSRYRLAKSCQTSQPRAFALTHQLAPPAINTLTLPRRPPPAAPPPAPPFPFHKRLCARRPPPRPYPHTRTPPDQAHLFLSPLCPITDPCKNKTNRTSPFSGTKPYKTSEPCV